MDTIFLFILLKPPHLMNVSFWKPCAATANLVRISPSGTQWLQLVGCRLWLPGNNEVLTSWRVPIAPEPLPSYFLLYASLSNKLHLLGNAWLDALTILC